MAEVRDVFDGWEDDVRCPRCGISCWIVDGDGQGRFWLLCMDVVGLECVETRDIPEGLVIAGSLSGVEPPEGAVDE